MNCKELIPKLCCASGFEEGTLYYFGKLGLLTGWEFWEAALGTISNMDFTVVTKPRGEE